MNQDLKIIKNKYGEKMMHLCRELFPTILEVEGALSKILLDKFEPSRFLYEDIIENKIEETFKSYIYNVFDSSFREEEIKVDKTPSELLDEAGYILYECKTESDIQSFKKYYKKGEELCTFNGERLDRCRVYFAVKKNIDEIKREDFNNPKRQDLYGTSVISIQFTKDASHTLSIKNRYNHTVANPDATFSNNLDNIIPGLTESFEKYYGMKQQFRSDSFEMPGYVMANDGKYYKYNFEAHNVYYCPNNIIIANFEVKRYPKEQYIVMDNYILNLKTGEIRNYDCDLDEFTNMLKNHDKLELYKEGEYKKIIFHKDGEEPIVIILDKLNNIVALKNNNVKKIGNQFLRYNIKIKKIELLNVEYIGALFLLQNMELLELNLPKVKTIAGMFLSFNNKIKKIDLPNLEVIDAFSLCGCKDLKKINIPKLKGIPADFLKESENLEEINVSNKKNIPEYIFLKNPNLKINSMEDDEINKVK